MVEECNHLEELMKVQGIIIRRHILKHKYYQHIKDDNEAVIDLVDKYMWVAREAFCEKCQESKTCEAYKAYLKNNLEIDESLKPK